MLAMKARRSLALLLSALLCLSVLGGCNGNEQTPSDPDVIEASSVPDIFGDDALFGDDEPGTDGSDSTTPSGEDNEPGGDGDNSQGGGNGNNTKTTNKEQNKPTQRPTAGTTSSTSRNSGTQNLVGNTYTSGFPIVKDKVTLKIMTYSRPNHAKDWNGMQFSKEYEAKTNIHIEWSVVPQASILEQTKIMLQTQNYPDILIVPAGVLYDSDVYTYGTQNVLWDISQSMKTYAPNLYDLLKDDKVMRMAVQQQNGSIYSLPYINGDYPGASGHAWTINKKWLDKLGLSVPKTTEELEQVLLAFKNNDPDGDGIQNQIPFMTFCYMPEFFGPWGLYFDWANNVMIDNSGKAQFVFTQNEMREAVLYWKNLHKQGLLDVSWTERTTTEMSQMISGGKVGLFLWSDPYTSVSPDILKDYVVMDVPKATTGVGSNFTAGVMRHNANVQGNSTFIFNTCRNKEAALRWLDYFYSYEGNAFKNYLDVGGKYLKQDSSGKVYVDVPENANTLNDTPGSVIPGIYDDYFFNGYFATNPNQTEKQKFASQWSKTVKDTYKKLVPKNIWVDVTFTASEMKTIKKYEQYLNFDTCWYTVRRMIESGSDVVDPETGWNTWVSSKTKAGLDEYLSVHQKAYDRAK